MCTYSTFHSEDPIGGILELTVNKTEIGRIIVEDEGLSNLDLAPALLINSQVFTVEGTDEYFLCNC